MFSYIILFNLVVVVVVYFAELASDFRFLSRYLGIFGFGLGCSIPGILVSLRKILPLHNNILEFFYVESLNFSMSFLENITF